MEEQYYSESTNTKEQNSQNEPDYKRAEVTSRGRLKVFFVSENAVNLSNRKLSKTKVSLFSNGKKMKEDLEKFSRTFRLKCHYRNADWTFHPNPLRPKSKCNPSKN